MNEVQWAVEVFEQNGISATVNKDNQIIISHYCQPKGKTFEELGINGGEIINGNKDDNINSILYLFETMHMMNNDVWFVIKEKGYDRYYISLFYDNLFNKPNGEDL